MGFLDKLNKRMSAPGADRFSEERFKKARPQVPTNKQKDQSSDLNPPILVDVEAEARKRRHKLYWIIGGVSAVILVSIGTFFTLQVYREAHTIKDKDIALEVSGPEAIMSGEEVEFDLSLKNKSRVAWKNVALEISLPDGFILQEVIPAPDSKNGAVEWGVGDLRPGASVEFRLEGKLVGEEGDSAAFSSKVLLTPENAPSSRQSKTSLAAVRIDEIPVEIAMEVPKQASSGEKIRINIVYQNRTTVDVEGARLEVETPEGFTLESTQPQVQRQDLKWDLGVIPQQSEGSVLIIGTIAGEPEESRPFKASIGFVTEEGKFLVQREKQATTTMARRALSIAQVFNEKRDTINVNPGETVKGKVVVKNTGDIGLRDLLVETNFQGLGIDSGSVDTEQGFYDSRSNSISWSAASVSTLKAVRPGDSTELNFKFRVLPSSELPFNSEEDKNFSVTAQTVADSPDLPTPPGETKKIASGKFEIMLNSVLDIKIDAFYDDGRTELPQSTGPLPPRVGSETTYTVRVRVYNTSNEVVDAVYRTTLLEGVEWLDNKFATRGEVSYNKRTKEVEWNIGALPTRAGTALPAPEFSFQVSLVPSMNQLGSKPALTLGSSVSGTDVFTAARLRAEAEKITTENVDSQKAEVVR